MSRFYPNLTKKSIAAFFVVGSLLFYPGISFTREPDDAMYEKQSKIWQQINAPRAWDFTTGNKKIVVAVIDIGVDTWHPDLEKNIWVNSNEIAENDLDDDGNGYIDDISGWNFVENNNDPRVSVFDKNADKEAISHGTIIAGIIGAVSNNKKSGAGLNWDVSIMPIRAINNNGTGNYSDIARAINYAVENGAKIINLSFVGNEPDVGLKEVLRNAYNRGVFIVTASGNSGYLLGDKSQVSYPACYDQGETNWIIGVSAVDNKDNLSYFSNYGTCVDILAPGEGIFSLQRFSPQFGFYDEFGGPWQGTSFATAFISGAAALVKSLHPEWSPLQIKDNLLQTADDLFFKINGDEPRLFKRLNVGKAVEVAYSTKITLDNLDGFYFYRNGKNNNSEIFYYDLEKAESRSLVKLTGKVVAFSSLDVNDDGMRDVVFILQKGDKYSLQVYTGKGELARDFTLVSKGKIAYSFTGVKFDVDANKQINFVLSKYYPAQKVTKFVKYNWHGKYLNEFGVVGQVAGWEVNDFFVYVGTIASKKFTIREIDWGGNAISEMKFSNITAVDSFKKAHIDNLNSDQLVFVVRNNSGVFQYTLDWLSQSFYKENVDQKATKWSLLFGKYQNSLFQNVFRFSSNGGSFSIKDNKGKNLKTYTLPKIIGTVE